MIRSRSLFWCHTPGPECQPGQVHVDDDGREWRITKLVEMTPTRLLNGGLMPCWDVRGKPVRRSQ
jgi:hypothetical protein